AREIEVFPDRRQRDVHDRDVEDGHEVRRANDGERLPAARIELGHLRSPSRFRYRGETHSYGPVFRQCRKCRLPVKTMAAPAASTAARTSSSRFDPPGCTSTVTPASSASCGPSANGKNASLASTAPAGSWPRSCAFSIERRTASILLICPAPIPIVWPSFARTIAFEATCLHTIHAKTISGQRASSTVPQTTSMPSRVSGTESRCCTSRPPTTRL